MQYAEVAVNAKTKLSQQLFTYKIKPDQLPYLKIGVVVLVPFHGKLVEGILIQIISKVDFILKNKLKSIDKIIESEPILTPENIRLAKWISNYYLTTIGEVIFTMIPQIAKRQATKKSFNTKEYNAKIINNKSNIYTIYDSLSNRKNCYVDLISKSISKNKSCLIIFPEIYKIENFALNVKEKFKEENIFVFHGNMKVSDHYKIWQEIKKTNSAIIIGSRSAIFTPINNLGLVILDEPNNFGYKEEQSPHYNTIDVVKKICEYSSANLILGDIYPDIQSHINIKRGIYKLIKRPEIEKKINDIEISVINSSKRKIISYELENKIKYLCEENKKILLIVNKKGSGKYYICEDCGEIMSCPRCSLPLTLHTESNKLYCSHCNTNIFPPSNCQKCNGQKLKSLGVASGYVKNLINKINPSLKISIVDNDMKTSDIYEVWNKNNIMIATQKILELELKFDLSAIIDFDGLTNIPDFNQAENIYLMILKLINISEKELLIQSNNTESNILYNIKSPKIIFNQILNERKKYNYPPYSRLIKLVFKDRNISKCIKNSEILKKKLVLDLPKNSYLILGPSPSFIAKKRDKYYFQIILKIVNNEDAVKKELIKTAGLEKWVIDIDPISLL